MRQCIMNSSPLASCLVLLLTACTPRAPAPVTVERPTLCQLAAAREAYAGRTLTVEGYLLVSYHGSAIIDPRCGHGVGIKWSRADGPRLQPLTDIADRMRNLEPGPWLVRIRITGVMQQDEHEGFAGRPWQVRLDAAEVLSARQLPPEDETRFNRWREGPSAEPFRPSR